LRLFILWRIAWGGWYYSFHYCPVRKSTFMPRPIHAHIDLDALKSNLRVARKATSSRIMAVIKANAYGHGLLRVAEALEDAEGIALLDVHDAAQLREAGCRQTILLLEGFFSPEDLQLIAEYDTTTVIHNAKQLAILDAYPRRGKLDVWLKVNTGMNRLGFTPEETPAVMEHLQSHSAVREVTLMTHFSHADEDNGIATQLDRFNGLTSAYRAPRSLANSAALLRYPSTHADWVRPGIMLYGASPFAETSAQQLGLKPVMSLSSELISVRDIKAGEIVGYGGKFRAESDTRIGVVACGYADGYPRHAPTGTPILVNGQRTRTLGRISMDMLGVDLGNISDAQIGSRVVMWGPGLPVEEVATAAKTVSYELLCAIAARVPVGY
jgi:alanine racemase